MSVERMAAALADRYRIEREVGVGGMATVYLAHDLKHDRNVALKVLKPELAAVVGSERFLAEIRTTANLQHPHILPLFDSGEAYGFLFFVLPYVEGGSLRERLDREKQLPVQEAVRIATEVADALAHAHERGVIHRDIKPANILLRDGHVQVADFGIALAVQQAGGTRLTETGLSLGTPSYMSPEQAAGDREVDGRTDIYAVGCLLYEMLTGEPPHTGSTAQAILAHVLTQRPRPLIEMRDTVPAWLEAVTERSLARLPADRFQEAGELRDSLLKAAEAGSPRPGPTAPTPAPWGWGRVAAAAAVGLVVGWVLTLLFRGDGQGDDRQTYFTAHLPADVGLRVTLEAALTPSVAISPDGREVVFVGERSGRRLYRMRLDAPGGTEPIPGTEGARAPFYSPSGAWIGFATGNDLMKVARGGGRPTPLARVHDIRGGAWDVDEEYIYYAPFFDGVYRIPADGGESVRITEPANDGVISAHEYPTILPNGDLLFTSCCTDVQTYILEGSDPEGTPRLLLDGAYARYIATGHLIFVQEGATLIAPYDISRREVGPAEEILPDAITAHERFGEYAVSASGTLAYLAGRSEFDRPLVRVYLDGTNEPVSVPPASHIFPIRVSPDGGSVLYSDFEDGGLDVYAYDLERGGQPQKLTRHPSGDYSAIWGPGADFVTFTSLRDGGEDVYTLPINVRGAEPEVLVRSDLPKWPLSWSADGRWLLFGVGDPKRGASIWLYSAEADSAWAFIDEEYEEWGADFSPSGEWIAYTRDDVDDRMEVWAMGFTDGTLCSISIGGGVFPQWGPDSRSIYYVNADTLMVAEAVGGNICAARPRAVTTGVHAFWGLAPDGSYAITVAPEPEVQLRLVLGWAQGLEGR